MSIVRQQPNLQGFDYSREFELLARAYAASGGDPSVFKNNQVGLLLVSGNKVLTRQEIPGLTIKGKTLPDGVSAKIIVHKNRRLETPVHLCFGMLPAEGIQRIIAEFVVEDNARASFIAHCTFPNAVSVQHIMEGTVTVGKNAYLEYNETHFHGSEGGVEVLPKMKIEVKKEGRYHSTFKLVQGAAGKVELDYDAVVEDRGQAEMHAKIYGKQSDSIRVRESIYLNGKESHGLAKSRIVVADRAHAEVLGEVVGNGAFSRGHVDCMEIIQGKHAIAEAIPKLQVVNETAKLTHEAAIGSVDKKQVETLMARGLSEQEAVDVIVMGLLK